MRHLLLQFINPNDLYITGVQTGVTDKNGRTKNVLQALCLSKDRECYKEIEQTQEQAKSQDYGQSTGFTNLPAKQNIFSRFFNQIRARFLKGRKDKQLTNQFSSTKQHKEGESWELKPDEKKNQQRIQSKIGEKYRENEGHENQSLPKNQQLEH